MDIVITFVNAQDPVWQKQYEQTTKTPILTKRYRDWGTLKYLLRGIEQNMPFIRKVHLVVSSESQVPEWVNREEVHVVLHSDIIPAEYLPTFNSNTIELHMFNIEDLDEEFLYFNDDIFPMKRMCAEDFFLYGKGIIGMSRHVFSLDMFKKICRNSDRAARKALGLKPTWYFLRPQHICAPMLRSECRKVYEAVKDDILRTLSRTRQADNITQYLFTDYAYLKGRILNRRQPSRHFSMAVAKPEDIARCLEIGEDALVCINDVQLSDKRYLEMHEMLHSTFERVFCRKSRFER